MRTFENYYRRLAHVFASTFISYYFIPDDGYFGVFKKVLVLCLFLIALTFDMIRLRKKKIKIAGLRDYEENRLGSYVYFGLGTAILLIVFPQQIAIPCIVSASLIDPIFGELKRINISLSYILSFLLSFFIFYSTWLSSRYAVIISLVSALSINLCELKKFKYIDDDLLMQMIPGILISIILMILGENAMPRKIIYPILEVK